MQRSLDDINDEDLAEIQAFGATFLTPKEIAIIMEMDQHSFIEACSDESTKIYKSYHSGRLKSEFELRQAVYKLAKSGSSPAQTMMLDLINESKQKMLD